jgi:hypothetical protein
MVRTQLRAYVNLVTWPPIHSIGWFQLSCDRPFIPLADFSCHVTARSFHWLISAVTWPPVHSIGWFQLSRDRPFIPLADFSCHVTACSFHWLISAVTWPPVHSIGWFQLSRDHPFIPLADFSCHVTARSFHWLISGLGFDLHLFRLRSSAGILAHLTASENLQLPTGSGWTTSAYWTFLSIKKNHNNI